MPIYEFKCLQCDAFFEILLRPRDAESEVRCPKCRSQEFQRVLSTTNMSMGGGSGTSPKTRTTSRNCASGSCGTLEIPGPNG